MWEDVARMAAADTGSPGALRKVDAVHVAHCMSWAYDDAPRRLADRLGINATHRQVSVLAGTAGQRMVNRAAERMLAGDSNLALVVGGEALATLKSLRQAGSSPDWSHPAPEGAPPAIDLSEWIAPTEWAHEVLAATLTFAALDTARRASTGLNPVEYRRREAVLLSRFTDVAATDPHAWFPIRRSPAEIEIVTAANRMISSPYSKYMVAIMDVDMAAGLLVCTHERANELGVAPERRVYLRGWSFGRDATHVAQRPFLDRSPAMAAVGADALSRAGVDIDDIAHIDLYSCFASSVLFATDALGLDPSDSRGFTVTGGLPYHGGPASNYTTHAIAAMVDRLRERGDGYGLVTGVGMHMTKHVSGIYSPQPGPVTPPDYPSVQAGIDEHPIRPLTPNVADQVDARIASYSVTHRRDGTPATALIIADLPDGSRAYARTEHPDLLRSMQSGEWVGTAVTLRPGPDKTNTFAPRQRPISPNRASVRLATP
jgi:acetyl-CoA C-acetyltransferase